jgi:hypothetical protein
VSARDIHHGRQGGRVLAWEPVAGETIVAVCDGCAAPTTVVRASIGQACWGCGGELRRPDEVDAALRVGDGRAAGEGWGVRVVPARRWAPVDAAEVRAA